MQFRGTGHQTHTTKKMSCLLFCFALLTINLKVLSTIQHCFQLRSISQSQTLCCDAAASEASVITKSDKEDYHVTNW